jgi:hypothetical protein
MEKKTLKHGITFLANNFRHELSDLDIRMYYMALDDIEDETFLEGVVKILKNRVYSNMPTVAEIRKYCGANDEVNSSSNGAKAYQVLMNTVTRYGKTSQVQWQDERIYHVVKLLGGYYRICTMTTEQHRSMEKKFIAEYQNLPDGLDNVPTGDPYPDSPVKTRLNKIYCDYITTNNKNLKDDSSLKIAV